MRDATLPPEFDKVYDKGCRRRHESGSFGITKAGFEPDWEKPAFISLSLLGKGCILTHELRPDSATHHICSLGKRTDLDAEE